MVASLPWPMIRPTLVGVLIGVGLLWLFYTVVRTAWPVYYASLGPNDYGIVVNRGALRYFGFAVIPVYAVALVVSTTVGRLNGHAMFCALAIGGVHAARTQLRYIFVTLRNSRSRLRLPSVSYAAVMAVLIAASSFAAGLGPGPVPQVVPEPQEFFNAFWTTAFVALLTTFVALKARSQNDPKMAFDRSLAEVGTDLVNLARATAVEYDADPNLTVAILLTENLQRPPWFRRIERLRGRFIPRGSYGVMQVQSDRPITDEQSIQQAIALHLAGARLPSQGYARWNSARRALRRYNPDDSFVDLGMEIFQVLENRRLEAEEHELA